MMERQGSRVGEKTEAEHFQSRSRNIITLSLFYHFPSILTILTLL